MVAGQTGAAATASVPANVGTITGITVTYIGSGYTTPPTVGFTGTGTGATATATVIPGNATSDSFTGGRSNDPGKLKLIATRKAVERGWRATADILTAQDHPELAAYIHRFLARMSPPRTEMEQRAAELVQRAGETREPCAMR